MGKHYTYSVDFSDGAGQDENGKQIISGKEMALKVKVAPWDAKAVALLEKVITGTAYLTVTYKVGGYSGTSYTVTPDASGNWSIPVSKFDGVTDMSYMFNDCYYLTSLDLSHFNTSNVTKMNGMFKDCDHLTSLDLSGWDVSNVTRMYGMFYYCEKLTSLDLSHFDTSKVTDMSSMFYYCEKLTSLDLSHFDTSKVTDMSYMFSCCKNLTSLNLSHFDTSKVTDMSSMFALSSFTTLDLSGWDVSSVTWSNMDDMFDRCSSLKTIRMKGCSEKTINKIKGVMPSGCTIVTE